MRRFGRATPFVLVELVAVTGVGGCCPGSLFTALRGETEGADFTPFTPVCTDGRDGFFILPRDICGVGTATAAILSYKCVLSTDSCHIQWLVATARP